MSIKQGQLNIFELFEEMGRQDAKASPALPDVSFKILSLERQKALRDAKEGSGYTDYQTIGLDAKLGSVDLEREYLSHVEKEVFKKLNSSILNNYYGDLFSKDDDEFNKAVDSIKKLVGDKYIYIEDIVRDDGIANLSRSRPRIRPIGLRFVFKDSLGYTALVYTNDQYSGTKLVNKYLGNAAEGYNKYFLKYKDFLPMFLYLKIIRDFLDNEKDIQKEYDGMIQDAIEQIQVSDYGWSDPDKKPYCDFNGIDILYSLKQFVRIGAGPISRYNLSSEDCYETGRFYLSNRNALMANVRCVDLLSPVFKSILEDYCKAIRCTAYEIERERISKSDYAASYQDKKTTNNKYLKAAERSVLKKYFVKVEIDIDVDLKLFGEYEKQIAYFYNLFDVEIKGLVLRLRKLGKHKASGLFFPHANCLCVDIRNPDSFVHEFFHAIDYNKGTEYVRCHSFTEFKAIHRLYTKLLDEALDKMAKDNPLRVRLLGSSKYNLDYYKDPYEVFARCGEIYFHELYGDKYSISSELLNEGMFYPIKDEALVGAIKGYFNDLFKRIKKEVA
jgi:hypothetical protein